MKGAELYEHLKDLSATEAAELLETLLRASERSARAAIMARNLSHNCGPHLTDAVRATRPE